MKNKLLLGFILITMSSLSQTPPDYLPDGSEWRIRVTNAGNYPYMFFQDDYVYYIAGDTTVGTHSYRKIFPGEFIQKNI